MQVLVSGSTGLIGSALVASLRADGHSVRRLVRHPPAAPDEVPYEPAAGVLSAVLAEADAVVHLAGVGIGDRRWTPKYQRLVRDSRVVSTRALAESIARSDPRPATLVCASAVGVYGDTGDEAVTESAPPGRGFLAELVRDWEAAADPARAVGVRVAHVRSGIVLDRSGGALAVALPIFRLGLGGRLGSGRQWLSWIALPDEIAAIRFVLDSRLSGPVNLTAPNPVRNAEYTRAVAAAVRRPAVLAVPAVALRLRFGGFADEGVLASQRVLPARLESAGFRFRWPELGPALHALLA
jgi:uncharacterized protein (TIGR01777 family)